MYDASLLPAPDASVRCAPHSHRHGYDPGGTAIAASRLLVAELPAPWPKPVFAHPALAGFDATTPTPGGNVRILAALPRPGATALRLVRYDRTLDGAVATVTQVASPDELRAELQEAITTAQIPAAAAMGDRAVLVCTQGTHDVCCGIEGTRLALQLETDPDLTVIRVSHTGGHRFAPTVLTLPDGRMWAHVDAPTLDAIVGRKGDPAVLASRCRGWWGADSGAAQVAELAVFAQMGWEWDDTVRRVAVHDRNGETATWRVTGNSATWLVATTPQRTIPVIACRSPGGLPAKPATEFAATIVARP